MISALRLFSSILNLSEICCSHGSHFSNNFKNIPLGIPDFPISSLVARTLTVKVKVKVKQSRYRPGVALRFTGS